MKCDLCDNQKQESNVKVKDGSTTNLFTHLENHHPDRYAEIAHVALGSRQTASRRSGSQSSGRTLKPTMIHGQRTIVDALDGTKPYSQTSDRYKACINSVTRYLVSGEFHYH